jgi:hypothetical protein
MSNVVDVAASGRSKCRACDRAIDKGELRFGERLPNPFGEGEATYWFHPRCAAYRRSEPFLALDLTELAKLADPAELLERARLGVAHHRLQRLAGEERAKSGRAKCRHCKNAIAGGEQRIILTIWEEARFSPMGFIHKSCANDYFGTDAWQGFSVTT